MDNCFPENRTALVGNSVSKAALHQYLLVSIAHQQVKSHRSLISIYDGRPFSTMEVEHEQALAEPSSRGNDGSPTTHIDKSTAFAAMLRNSELLKHFVNTFNAVPPLEERPSPPAFLPESFTTAELLAKHTKHLMMAHHLTGAPTSPEVLARAHAPKSRLSPSATVTKNAAVATPKLTPKRESPELDDSFSRHQVTPYSRPSSYSSSEASLPGSSSLSPSPAFLASPILPPMAAVSMATAAALATQAQLQVQLHAQAQMQAQMQAVVSLPPIPAPESIGALTSVVPMWGSTSQTRLTAALKNSYPFWCDTLSYAVIPVRYLSFSYSFDVLR
ncbi:hypothetical protein LSH36_622g01015 [Paralvinella palmiformis]|uniref:Uncharacterized protein n=1 Tax=Paralvinella palmiformis TaxID=53620 RepID=A0AAD9MUG9_9ANNE|nr:hypothetical protein LSH36_622g01015 [Paralvinella palmiformis]